MQSRFLLLSLLMTVFLLALYVACGDNDDNNASDDDAGDDDAGDAYGLGAVWLDSEIG